MAKGVFFKVDTRKHLKKSSMKKLTERSHFKRVSKKSNPTKWRKSITPGTVLILLAGRFKGKRVVFLKQLENGLLLVTGPFKLNGVPLRRVNQSYVMSTSSKLDISKLNLSEINNDFFAKKKAKFDFEKKQMDRTFELTEEDKKNLENKKKMQTTIDSQLMSQLNKDKIFKSYVGTRFTLRNKQFPHEMKF